MFSESSPKLLGLHGSCSSAKLPVELSENMLQNLLLNLPPQTVFTYLGRPRPFILRGSAGTETLLLNTEGTAVSFKYLFMKISNILKQVEKKQHQKSNCWTYQEMCMTKMLYTGYYLLVPLG